MAGKNVWVQDIQMFDSSGNVKTNAADEKVVNAVLSNDGSSGQAHNRLVSIAGNTLATDIGTATWGADEKVTACRFKVSSATSGQLVRIVFDATPVDDATDTTQAINWLTPVTAAANANTDVEYFEVTGAAQLTTETDPAGVDQWSDWFDFGSYLRRVDAIAVTTDEATSLFIEVR